MNLPSDPLIKKRLKTQEHLCCPHCHSDLEYPNAFTFHGIPFAGNIICPNCDQVGVVMNGRNIFNPDERIKVTSAFENYCGSIEQRNEPVSRNMLFPATAWQESNGSYWSIAASSRLIIQSSCLAIGVSLLKHPWSGFAEVWVDGVKLIELDLFEAAGSMQQWVPIHLGEGSHSIEIIVTGKKNPQSYDCQVHVLELEMIEKIETLKPTYRYASRNRGNAYPLCFDGFLNEEPMDGLILDCGSGDRNHPDPRVVSFEYSRFQGPDIFGDGHKLPFKNNSFDFVLSQAVFEHLHDPFVAAKEIFRVLKPGGRIYVESAFMQPLHAVPFHFFNTTAWGLERLFSDFIITKVTHEGALTQTLDWFYRLTALREKGFGEKIDQVLSLAKELDDHITPEELKSFSSYVTLLAVKPD